MRHRFVSVTGFVLVGGASRRMGRPKANLVVGDETMLERQIRLLRSVSRSVAVLGPPASFTELDVLAFPDALPGRGPLGGLYAGLQHSRTEFNLFLSCDVPFMEALFLHYLCQRALESRADVTVPESHEGGYHPLCAVYRRRALWAVRASLAAGENKVSRFFAHVPCRVLAWREIARAGFAPRIFANINTPEEYEAAKRSLQWSALSTQHQERGALTER